MPASTEPVLEFAVDVLKLGVQRLSPGFDEELQGVNQPPQVGFLPRCDRLKRNLDAGVYDVLARPCKEGEGFFRRHACT